jgi:hypothetical protein
VTDGAESGHDAPEWGSAPLRDGTVDLETCVVGKMPIWSIAACARGFGMFAERLTKSMTCWML